MVLDRHLPNLISLSSLPSRFRETLRDEEGELTDATLQTLAVACLAQGVTWIFDALEVSFFDHFGSQEGVSLNELQDVSP